MQSSGKAFRSAICNTCADSFKYAVVTEEGVTGTVQSDADLLFANKFVYKYDSDIWLLPALRNGSEDSPSTISSPRRATAQERQKLFQAAAEGDLGTVYQLIASGIDISTKSKSGEIVLHFAQVSRDVCPSQYKFRFIESTINQIHPQRLTEKNNPQNHTEEHRKEMNKL